MWKKKNLAEFTIENLLLQCLVIYDCASSSSTPDTSGDSNRPLYAVLIVLGCIDVGVGHEQLKLLSAVNLPTICRNTVKIAEERVGTVIFAVAKESCLEALSEGKRLTVREKGFRIILEVLVIQQIQQMNVLVHNYSYGTLCFVL